MKKVGSIIAIILFLVIAASLDPAQSVTTTARAPVSVPEPLAAAADLVLLDGRIWTGSSADSVAEALAEQHTLHETLELTVRMDKEFPEVVSRRLKVEPGSDEPDAGPPAVGINYDDIPF